LSRGSASPLGAAVSDGGVNFSVFSRDATSIDLLLFDQDDSVRPSRILTLDRKHHRTYHYWHVFVPEVRPGQLYGYRAHGPFDPQRGLRFDGQKLLLDPCGLGVAVPATYSREAARRPGENGSVAMKSIVIDPTDYDWQGDEPLRRPFAETVIYELHVRGFTQHPSSGVPRERAGTFAGLIDKIPYLKDLGITAVELLPIAQFDPEDAPAGRRNYWGYAPVSFFAPHCAYSARRDPFGPLSEFRDMVKALHRAGIEVFLDVVFNHTSEGDHTGPTQILRGFANDVYYLLGDDRRLYANYSGTGNTLNANNAVVRRLIRQCLRYWVEQMHVDGFRFDLASILARDESGRPMLNPPILWDIESDPVLAGTKLIAEAWDSAGLYQVGSFIGDAWHEWNGRFRDHVRRFVKSDPGMVRNLAARLLGSPDVFGHENREPEQSVNFVTCHDGFTLHDLVTYNSKHNETNGEGNRDGSDDNASWNCACEGPSDDPAVETLRSRQVRNFLTLLMLSVGTPMLCMGDEVRRTQRGNNNAYCQDNEVSWFDWTLGERHADLHRFVKALIEVRQRNVTHIRGAHVTLSELLSHAPVTWHGVDLDRPDWSDESRSLAFTMTSPDQSVMVHAMLNAYWEALDFALPESASGPWRRWIDTAQPPPDDIVPWERAIEIPSSRYRVQPRSVVYLIAPLMTADRP
jgi:glycogen operon protein